MKKILKIVFSLILGMGIGLVITTLFAVLLTDISFSEFIEKCKSIEISEMGVSLLVGMLATAVSIAILVVSHEAGHLIFGLMSGYKFVSFRIFNLTIIRKDGKFGIKWFSIAGTGGQCLLLPPNKPIEKISTGWYNIGGVLVNIIEVIVAVILMPLFSNALLSECLFIFILIGFVLIIFNSIPMKLGGSSNDAYNMLALRKNMIAKRGLVDALRINCESQNGRRLKDMPESWFEVPENIDMKNQLEVSIPLSAASRLVDTMDFHAAQKMFEDMYVLKDRIIPIYIKEIVCELIFLRMTNGETAKAEELLTPDMKRYIDTYRNVMSSKQRILCAIALYLDKDRNKALTIYDSLKSREKEYLLQGEAKSDLAIMQKILEP